MFKSILKIINRRDFSILLMGMSLFVSQLCVQLIDAQVAQALPIEAVTPRTEGLLAALKAVDGVSEDERENKYKVLDAYFDFNALTSQAIKSQRSKLSQKQFKHYQTSFQTLIRRIAYPDTGSFLKRAGVVIGKENNDGTDAKVATTIEDVEEDIEMDVVFFWRRSKAGANNWKVVDVAFDDARLTSDYQNQFARIIGKHGVKGLLSRLDKKLAEMK